MRELGSLHPLSSRYTRWSGNALVPIDKLIGKAIRRDGGKEKVRISYGIINRVSKNICLYKIQCLRLLHPVLVFPDGVVQEVLDQRSPPQSAGQGQVALGRFLDIICELRSSKPALFAFHFTIRRSPANLTAENFKVSLGLSPLFLLNRVSKLTLGELLPKSLNCRQVSVWDILNISKVNKIAALGLCARDFNESIASEL